MGQELRQIEEASLSTALRSGLDESQMPNPYIISQSEEALNVRNLWKRLEPRLKAILGAGDFRAYIGPLSIASADEKNIYLIAPNAFTRSRVRTEYLHRLQAIWNDFDVSKRRLIVDVAPVCKSSENLEEMPKAVVAFNVASNNYQKFESNKEIENNVLENALSPKTFASFEQGASNNVAIAVAKRIANEGSNGEIVFFHGLNGVGKTHLLSAIANQSLLNDRNRRVVSLTAQRFLNLFQNALRDKDTGPFKEGLRSADILLVDDIQLICGKTATQEEFFQTIMDLVSRGKSVVCTADVPPEGLLGLTPRMMGILLGGFNVRINEPDFELRRKIASRKVTELAIKRPDFSPPAQALDILAARVIGTGRNIEGAVKQIFASSALIGQEATMEVVMEAIGDRLPTPMKSVPVDIIKKRVAAHFDISIDDLIGTRRHISVARPRQIVMYFCKKFTKRSYPDIASRMGGRDHTTVMHAVKRIEGLANSDPKFASELQNIANKILA